MIPQPGAPVLPASGSGIPRLNFVTYQGSYCTRMSQGLAGGGVVRPCVPATGKGHLFKDSGPSTACVTVLACESNCHHLWETCFRLPS